MWATLSSQVFGCYKGACFSSEVILSKIYRFEDLSASGVDGIYNAFLSGGGVEFRMSKACARRFKRQVPKINKMLKMRSGWGSSYSRIWSFAYSVYVSLLSYLISIRCENLDMALTVYMAAWRTIGSIDGLNDGEGMARLIFHGKTNS